MTEKPGIRGVFEEASGELRIRAKMDAFQRGDVTVVFGRSRIDMLMEDDETSSRIVLISGKAIHVRMPLAELEEKIYHPSFRDGNVLDLCSVTGSVVQQEARNAIRSRPPSWMRTGF